MSEGIAQVMELYFLGTGAGVPSTERNVSALALRLDKPHETWLFDCGEATQHQLLKSPLSPMKIRRVFITHLHGDHVFGLPGFLSSRSLQGDANHRVTVYGPTGIEEFLRHALRHTSTHVRYGFDIVEFDPTTLHTTHLYEDDHIAITFAPLRHGIPTVGFLIREKEHPGALDAEKLRALGVAPGPQYGELKRGIDVTLEDGRTLKPDDFRKPNTPGRRVAILGDTAPCKEAVALARDADVLVHESTFSARDAAHAHQHHHSTARDAAQTALAANAKRLILTHISPRYHERANDPADLPIQLLQEARSIFANTDLAYDHFHAVIPRIVPSASH